MIFVFFHNFLINLSTLKKCTLLECRCSQQVITILATLLLRLLKEKTLAPDLKRPTKRNCALKPQEQVLVALLSFAYGNFLEVVGDTVGGIPKCTVVECQQPSHEFVQWPSTAAERQKITQCSYCYCALFLRILRQSRAMHSRPQSPSFLGHVVGKRGALEAAVTGCQKISDIRSRMCKSYKYHCSCS